MHSPLTVDQRIGRLFRKLRHQKQIPMAHIAFKADLTPEFIEKIENGDIPINNHILFEFCDILGVDVRSVYKSIQNIQ